MFYKVIKNNKVIDVLDHLTYLKWQSKNKIMLLSDEGEAQAILGSDGNTIWHVEGFYDLPIEGYETVSIQEINQFEYKQLKMLNGKTPEEIIDAFVTSLIEDNLL
jgi:hypothetical protein